MIADGFILTTHAIKRFRERVRPGLAWSRAERDLNRLLAHGEFRSEAPSWLADHMREGAEMYLVVGDIVLPLAPSREHADRWLVLTCIAKGDLSHQARARRNRARNARNASREWSGSPRAVPTTRARLQAIAHDEEGIYA